MNDLGDIVFRGHDLFATNPEISGRRRIVDWMYLQLDSLTEFGVGDPFRCLAESDHNDLHRDEYALKQNKSCLQAMVSERPRGEPCRQVD